MTLLRTDELERIEREHASGISAREIVETFRPKGVALSEATFRKYVQSGLLPRSRRVGRKGKHQGSQGLYPVEAVRRINAIKKMMAEGMTLEEIKESFVFFRNHIDEVERGLEQVLEGFRQQLAHRPFAPRAKLRLESQLASLSRRSEALMKEVIRVGSAVTAQRAAEARSS